jgi:hypothetical protein
MKRILSISVTSLLALYVAAVTLPYWYFDHELQRGLITLHSTEKLDERYLPIIDQAIEKLEQSAIFDPDLEFRIFLCPDQRGYSFFSPAASDAFAATYPLLRNVFINRHDVDLDEVYRPSQKNNVRSLSGTIAHECTHVLLEEELGIFRYKLLAAWKNEGYCDHVADESSIGDEEGIAQFCNGTLDHAYFLGRLRVEQFLLGASTKELFSNEIDVKALDERSKARLCL